MNSLEERENWFNQCVLLKGQININITSLEFEPILDHEICEVERESEFDA